MKRATTALFLLLAGLTMSAPSAQVGSQERLMFPDVDNVRDEIIRKIDAEKIRLDIGLWFLGDGDIVAAIVRAHQRRVPVRVLGDRVGIFEADRNTFDAFAYLANAGVPIRIRYEPTWFPQIMHWKCAIFVGQGLVEFGSGNWTTFELMPSPWSPTDFKDETLMFTDDPAMFRAFSTQFDRYWAGQEPGFPASTYRDWPEVYKLETGQTWNGAVPMNIDRTRLVPEPTDGSDPTKVAGMVWSQGPELYNQMLADINAETKAIDFVSYRLTLPEVTDALIAKHQAGVPVRVFIEPLQYRNAGYPEYWLVGAQADRLWAAGVPIKIRTHQGLTHMKAIITSRSALVASSNFTRFWQRDHNYFIPANGKPQLYLKYKDQFNKMWCPNSPNVVVCTSPNPNYTDFAPSHPEPVALVSPGSGTSGVAVQPKLEWKRAPWAVFFDIYLGTNQSAMTKVGTVNAQMDETPPETYSYTPTQALLGNTTYYWYVVSRSYATVKKPSLISTSETRSFTTGAGGGGNPPPTGPFGGTPASLPGTIEAENFDNGANNTAYFDTTAGNAGGVYRLATDVDIAEDGSGGFTVGWMSPSEWLAYSVNVATAGTYTLEFKVASLGAGGTFHLEANGTNVTGPLTVPNTNGWLSWQTVTKTGVTLGAGSQVWRLVMDTNGSSGAVGNVNSIRVVSGGGTTPPPPTGNTPYGGTPTALPGLLQAENFDEGGPNVGYVDTTAGNAGGQYRTADSVDIEASGDAGGGYNLGWVKAGEWLKYTVNVAAAGTYTLEFRVAAPSNGGTFHLEVNGADKTGPMTIPSTGGYQSWTTISKTGVALSAGQQVWRLVIDSAGSVVGNINYIRVVSSGGTPPPSGPTPFSGTAVALPGRVEVENFDNGGPGVAYQDLDAANAGGVYRQTEGVDISANTGTGGGYVVGWAFAGEWLKYSVNVANAGTYDIVIEVASNGAGGTFHIEFNGVDKTGPIAVPNTGGWMTWTTIRKTGVTLSAGPQQIRLVMDTNGPTTATGNFNWIRIALPGQ
jgi:hypothetical protein